MTAPDHRRARFAQGVDQPGGLRVVKKHDVAGAHAPRQLAGARAQRPLVDLPLRITELAAVSRRPVEAVVNPLRHREEGRGPVDHDPARIDAGPAGVAEQRLQQLHHSPAPSRRVDVPDGATREQLRGSLARRLDLRVVLADQRAKALGAQHRNWHVDRVRRRSRSHAIALQRYRDGDAKSSRFPGRPLARSGRRWDACGLLAGARC